MFKPETMVQMMALRNRLDLLPSFTRVILEERWRKRDRGIHVEVTKDGKDALAMPQTVADEEELLAELERQLGEVDDELVSIQYQRNPSHVVALEQQLLALRVNTTMYKLGGETKKTALQKATLQALKSATPYCWSPTCVEAVAAKASLLPDLSRPAELPVECKLMQPAESGWWWFERPLPLRTVQGREPVVALSWRREVRQGPVEIMDAMGSEKLMDYAGPISLTWFCAFIHEPVEVFGRQVLAPNPTLAWLWIDTVPLKEHAENVQARFSELTRKKLQGVDAASDADSVHAAMWLSKFWLSGALWLNSRIIGSQRMALPRQQGRALAREHKLEKPPLVEVVYLRRAEPKPHDPLAPKSTEPKHHDFCWLVGDFPRRQWYPSKGRHELIIVEEHIRGPRDKPLKNAVKIYAVNR